MTRRRPEMLGETMSTIVRWVWSRALMRWRSDLHDGTVIQVWCRTRRTAGPSKWSAEINLPGRSFEQLGVYPNADAAQDAALDRWRRAQKSTRTRGGS